MQLKELAMTYCKYRIPLGAAIIIFFALQLGSAVVSFQRSENDNVHSAASRLILCFLCLAVVYAITTVYFRANPLVCGLTIASDTLSLF